MIGSGISGLSAAWLLSQTLDVTLYEKEPRLGGHTCTIPVPGVGPVDMGFIVYNEWTYPNLVGLFRHLGVATQPSDMSFSVSVGGGRMEYAGTDLRGLLAQPSNLLRPRFWSMLRDLLRFYREAPQDAAALSRDLTSLDDYLLHRGYGDAFVKDHLLPMAAAIWSTPDAQVGAYPAVSFIRFCESHGLLKLRDRPVWRTVTGGSASYLEKLAAPLTGKIRTGCGVVALRRTESEVQVQDESGSTASFDEVVVATHAPQALTLLADPSDAERTLLGSIGTTANRVVMHRDPRLMPLRRAAWASWNHMGFDANRLCVTYWMNRLQALPRAAPPIFVTLNPPFEPEGIVHDLTFAHPRFDAGAIRAQRAMWSLQGTRRTWYCGAWFGAGFHEDGLQAGLAVAEQLGGVSRPWGVPAAMPRIHRDVVPA